MTQVWAMTSWSTSPAMTCRYRFKVGLMSHHRHANADSSPLCARYRTLPKSLPITLRIIGKDDPAPQPIRRIISRSTPSTNQTATSTDRSADARARTEPWAGRPSRARGPRLVTMAPGAASVRDTDWDGVRQHVVTGKGGTGKTTVAAALALALAGQGRRVLLAEVEGRQGISQTFDVAPLASIEARIAHASQGGEVFGLSVDAKAALLEYLHMYYKLGRAGGLLEKFGAIDFATTIAPGVRDVLLIGKVYEAVRRHREHKAKGPGAARAYDAVVLDAPPTGRVARFLNVNHEVADLARVGPIRTQADSITAMLTSPQTVVHVVTLLAEMPVQETVDATDRHTDGTELGDGVDGLLNRHLLEQRHHVDDRLRRRQHRCDRVGLRADRADPREVGNLVVDIEESCNAAGGRGVQDDGVVGPRCTRTLGFVLPVASDRLVDLADQQNVPDAWRDRGGEVDGAELLQQPAGTAELVVHVEVLQQGCLGVDREPEDLAALRRVRDACLDRGQWGDVEGLADALASFDLGQQHPPSLARERQGQRCGDGCLACAALARDDVQSYAVPVGVAGRRRAGCHGDEPRTPCA